ncbi:hypothetical protein RFI_07735, partial [Reticulomyxa filosa]
MATTLTLIFFFFLHVERHIASPDELALPSPNTQGEWVWAEGWNVVMPSPENIKVSQELTAQIGTNPALGYLKSMQFFVGEKFIVESKVMGTLSPSITTFSSISASDDEPSITFDNSKLSDVPEVATIAIPEIMLFIYSFVHSLIVRTKSLENRNGAKQTNKQTNKQIKQPKQTGLKNRLSNWFGKKTKTNELTDARESSVLASQMSLSAEDSAVSPKKTNQNSESILIKDGTFDSQGWMYCGKPTKQLLRWRTTNQPSGKKIYRRRIWVRAAIWQPLIRQSSKQSDKPEQKDNATETESDNSADYLMTEILSSLIWHVHLMSHESLLKILPTDNVADLEKITIGKPHINQESEDGKQMEYRKRTESIDLAPSYGAKLANMTKSFVSSLAGINRKPASTYEHMKEVTFVENVRARAIRLGDLLVAMKRLPFGNTSFEDNSFYDSRLTIKQNLGSTLPDTPEGSELLCEKVFEGLSVVLSECLFHSSTQSYSSSDRNRLMKKLTEICTLYGALKDGNQMTNMLRVLLLLLLLLLFLPCAHYKCDIEQLTPNQIHTLQQHNVGIIATSLFSKCKPKRYDLFHMKKKLISLNLNNLQFWNVPLHMSLFFLIVFNMYTYLFIYLFIVYCMYHLLLFLFLFLKLCLFFPDMLTNMKHAGWIIRHKEKYDSLNSWNVRICQEALQGAQRNFQTWLKFMHDSVKSNVVAEVVLLYFETSTSTDLISKKPISLHNNCITYTHIFFYLFIYLFYSIVSVALCLFLIEKVSKIKEQYHVASILKGLNSELMANSQSYKVTANKNENHKMKAVVEAKKSNAKKSDTEKDEKKSEDETKSIQSPTVLSVDISEIRGTTSSIVGREVVSLASMTQVVQLNQYRQIQEQLARERADKEEKEQMHNTFLEYFRDESKKKLWWQYIEEIELLFQDDADISITLWKRGIFSGIPE